MAKKKTRYFIFYNTETGKISAIGKGSQVPKNYKEITKEDYERYEDLRDNNIPQKEGYFAKVTIYVDFTRTIEYIPDETEEEPTEGEN